MTEKKRDLGKNAKLMTDGARELRSHTRRYRRTLDRFEAFLRNTNGGELPPTLDSEAKWPFGVGAKGN